VYEERFRRKGKKKEKPTNTVALYQPSFWVAVFFSIDHLV
jgi:hypothetical protein